MYPILFEPIYQDYIWGGDKMAKHLGRVVDKERIAESWEVSDRADAMSVVANGPWKGKSLNELVAEQGEKLLGVGRSFQRFPLLLKIIDAKEPLSIQVHPDELVAADLNGEPKTEMWVALDSALVYAGLAKESNPQQFLKDLKTKHPEDFLEKLSLKRGEAVYIPGGRIHAICAGSFLFEVQQNSNTTYRVHDWDRKGRELHLDKAMAAIHWNDKGGAKTTPHHRSSDLHHQMILLGSSPFFIIEKIDIFNRLKIAATRKSFQAFHCMRGKADLIVDGHRESLGFGVTCLVPAACKSIEVEGRCELLRIRLP
jgi:mannose-6-phosphate isomerase